MTTTIRMTEAMPSGAVKMLLLWGDCLKVDPVCRQRAGLSTPEPAIGLTSPVPEPAPGQPRGHGGNGEAIDVRRRFGASGLSCTAVSLRQARG
jgi:hypothetical protein